MSETNGLPPVREAIIDQAHRLHQEVAHERDTLRLRITDLLTEIEGLKAQLKVAELEASTLRSRADSSISIRDDAVADRAVYEALFISIKAQLMAFKIPSAPLVRERPEETTDGYEDNLNRDDDPLSILDSLASRGVRP